MRLDDLTNTYHKHSPCSERCPKTIFFQRPVHNKGRDGAEDTSSGPKDTICETFSFHEPLVKIKYEGVVKQSSSDAIEKALREDEMNHMCREGCGEKCECDCEQTNY